MAAAAPPVGSLRSLRHSVVSFLRFSALVVAAFLVTALPCYAHLGSPDVYFQGAAGPYQLSAAIRTPQMIPGVADLQITSSTPGVRIMRVQPLYIAG